jgi:hypothetical protein
VAGSLQRLLDARSPRLQRSGGGGAAGIGLVLAYTAANELALHVAAGRFTEATAALHVAGSNRAAVARGSGLQLYL